MIRICRACGREFPVKTKQAICSTCRHKGRKVERERKLSPEDKRLLELSKGDS